MDNTERLPLPRYIAWIYNRVRLKTALDALSRVFVALTVLGFFGGGAYVLLNDARFVVLYLVFLGVPFAFVSLLRRWIDSKRPYEIYDFTLYRAPREKIGQSMPSRHVFSAFAIGILCLFVHLPLGICVSILGVFIAFFRVLLGIHFIRDVIVGALIGTFSGAVGGIILNNCLH